MVRLGAMMSRLSTAGYFGGDSLCALTVSFSHAIVAILDAIILASIVVISVIAVENQNIFAISVVCLVILVVAQNFFTMSCGGERKHA